MKTSCVILFPLCLMLTLCAGENSGTAESRIIEGFGYRNIDREIARRMDEKSDSAGLEETYAELLKERRALEKQLAAAGIPFDRESAIRFRMNGVKTDPRLYGEAAKRIKSMEGKMFSGLPPGLYSDAEAQRMQRTKFLESIQEDWAWIESHPVFPINMPWDPEKRLAEQSIQDLKLNTTLAQIWQMRIQEKAASGDVSGALEDFGRSRVVMELDGPIIAGLIAVSCELMRLNTLSELLSRAKLTPEQLKKLDEELQEDEVLLRRVWLHAWIQEGVCGLDIIESFIQGTAYEGLAKYRTEEGRMPLRFVVPWTREWIFLAKRNLRIAAETAQMNDYRPFSFRNEFPKQFTISNTLLKFDLDSANSNQFNGIAMIRAARTALRYLGLKSMEIPKDPFTGEPFRIRKGEFFEAGRTVRGIRFYSAGMDGKYTDGEYLKWGGSPKKTDDPGFDLVEPEVPASGTFIP